MRITVFWAVGLAFPTLLRDVPIVASTPSTVTVVGVDASQASEPLHWLVEVKAYLPAGNSVKAPS